MSAGVGAVVVHYRGPEPLAGCIASLLADDLVREVVVVDNEGVGMALRGEHRDGRVRVVESRTNLGFGRAANIGLDLVQRDAGAALVLNQDVAAGTGAVGELLRVAGESGARVVGPALVGADGMRADPKAGFAPPLSWEPPPAVPGDGWRWAPWVPGAAMLLAPGHLDLRFDRRLFMYAEDQELCYRVWRDGGAVALAERAVFEHVGGTAARERWPQAIITARTLANRARMVRWHAGWRGLPRYLAWDVMSRATRRVRRGP